MEEPGLRTPISVIQATFGVYADADFDTAMFDSFFARLRRGIGPVAWDTTPMYRTRWRPLKRCREHDNSPRLKLTRQRI